MSANAELEELKAKYEDLLNAAADLVSAVGQIPVTVKIHKDAQAWMLFHVSPAVRSLSEIVAR